MMLSQYYKLKNPQVDFIYLIYVKKEFDHEKWVVAIQKINYDRWYHPLKL